MTVVATAFLNAFSEGFPIPRVALSTHFCSIALAFLPRPTATLIGGMQRQLPCRIEVQTPFRILCPQQDRQGGQYSNLHTLSGFYELREGFGIYHGKFYFYNSNHDIYLGFEKERSRLNADEDGDHDLGAWYFSRTGPTGVCNPRASSSGTSAHIDLGLEPPLFSGFVSEGFSSSGSWLLKKPIQDLKTSAETLFPPQRNIMQDTSTDTWVINTKLCGDRATPPGYIRISNCAHVPSSNVQTTRSLASVTRNAPSKKRRLLLHDDPVKQSRVPGSDNSFASHHDTVKSSGKRQAEGSGTRQSEEDIFGRSSSRMRYK